jgi:RHS repeat-associated protein
MILHTISEDRRYNSETEKFSEAFVYNKASEKLFTVDNRGRVTSYSYDNVGRLVEALYPVSSEKIRLDLETMLEAGVVPTGFIRGGDEDWDDFSPNLSIREDNDRNDDEDDDTDDTEKSYESILKTHENLFGNRRRFAGELVQRLEVPYEYQYALEEAYGQFGNWRRLDLDQWVYREAFTYDSRNNRTVVENGWGTLESSYNAENQLLSTGENTYDYDLNGNLSSETTASELTTFTYNGQNRMVEALVTEIVPEGRRRIESVLEQYKYDALGRRIVEIEIEVEERIRRDESTLKYDLEEHRFTLYNGLSFNQLAHIEINGREQIARNDLGELEISYQRNAEVEMKNVYLFANGKILLEAEVKGTRRDWDDDDDYRWDRKNSVKIKDQIYFHQDILGSTIFTADERGSKERHVEYDAYGQLLTRRVESREFLYNGKQLNEITGFYNYGFRDYNASTARFTTVDPIRDGDNWFVYVDGEPVGRVDFLGLDEDPLSETANDFSDLGKALEDFLSDKYLTYFEYNRDLMDVYSDAYEDIEPIADYFGELGDIFEALHLAIKDKIIQRDLDEGVKQPPNPGGSRGGPAHRQKIDDRIDELLEQGYTDPEGGTWGKERTIIIPEGGTKTMRRPDITMVDPEGNLYFENVGRSKRDGSPIAREVKALDDIELATGIRPVYTPYDRCEE